MRERRDTAEFGSMACPRVKPPGRSGESAASCEASLPTTVFIRNTSFYLQPGVDSWNKLL